MGTLDRLLGFALVTALLRIPEHVCYSAVSKDRTAFRKPQNGGAWTCGSSPEAELKSGLRA
jgi:hypothetical protein